MDKILKLKHWQVFISLTIASIIGNTTIEGFGIFNSLLFILGFILLLSWPMVLGDKLCDLLPARITLNRAFFLLNCFLVLGAASVIKILFYDEGFKAEGLAALPFLYVFYAYFHFHSFPAKALKTLEIGRKAELGDYIGDFFLILIWPIGIWFIQPRVNKVVEKIELQELINHAKST